MPLSQQFSLVALLAQLQHTIRRWALSFSLQEAYKTRPIIRALVQAHLAWGQAHLAWVAPDLDLDLQRPTIHMAMQTVHKVDRICRAWGWAVVEWDSSQWVVQPQLSKLLIYQRLWAWFQMWRIAFLMELRRYPLPWASNRNPRVSSEIQARSYRVSKVSLQPTMHLQHHPRIIQHTNNTCNLRHSRAVSNLTLKLHLHSNRLVDPGEVILHLHHHSHSRLPNPQHLLLRNRLSLPKLKNLRNNRWEMLKQSQVMNTVMKILFSLRHANRNWLVDKILKIRFRKLKKRSPNTFPCPLQPQSWSRLTC